MSNTSLESLHDRSESPAPQEAGAVESGRWLAGLFVALLCIIHVGMNTWWLRADNHTIRTDEEGHMLLARTYHETLFVADYPGPVQRLIAVSQIPPGNPAHPPLLHALGAFMIALFGYSTDTIALTNTVLFVVLLLGCHALCRTFLDPWQSLFAVFVVSMTPMVYASSRFFMTDFAAAAITVWAVVALIRSEGFHRAPWVFFFGLLTGLGVLTRTITFAYLLVPAAVAVLVGLVRSLGHRKSTVPDAPSLGAWAVNIAMALTVMAGVFAPWYYTNLEPFYGYWANKRIGDTRGPLTSFVPLAPAPSAATVAQPDGGIVVTPPAAPSPSLYYAWEKVRNPAVAWIRYPVYLVNNGLFIPLATLALLGMATAWWRRQCRVPALLYLFAWIFGSWLFFTVCLRAGTPRYGLPVAPALSLFAALFILVLPGRLFRQCAGVLLIFVLCFQYGNITVQSYGELGTFTVAAPLPALQKESRHFIDDGLVLFKDHLTLSDAYGHLGTPRADNYKDRYFEIMMAHEAKLPERPGTVARYQKLRLRGMPLYERHYWPGENPYRLASLAPGDVPKRALTLIHMGLEPDHLLTLLPETDYILYEADAAQADQVAAWEAYFGERGFESIATFEVPAFGWVPRTINGVLARAS